ncbi:MAG: phage integrase N-terminal SAM-like domain-containing protein [Desulfobacterales bacterium]|nr:phage integrase N-terminal SAM-like domain-containing protein [Desulfobacterales bacterium]
MAKHGKLTYRFFHILTLCKGYDGKLTKIQTKPAPEAFGPGPAAGPSLSSLRLPDRTDLLRLDRAIHQILWRNTPTRHGKAQIEAFLSHLAIDLKVSASTRRQALNAIVFLYRHVLDNPVEQQIEPAKAKRHARPPVAMTKNEIRHVLVQMQGIHLLMPVRAE